MAQKLSNLPLGSKVVFGSTPYYDQGLVSKPIKWIVVAKNHSCTPSYPSSSVTLISEESVLLFNFDHPEPSSTNAGRASYGNNRYSLSNLDQMLNSSGAKKAWFTPSHSVDAHTYDNVCDEGGFLVDFTEDEKEMILPTTIRVALHAVDGDGYEDITRKVFAPSITETTGATTGGIREGEQWEYFKSAENRKGYFTDGTGLRTSKPYWLRTPGLGADAQYKTVRMGANGDGIELTLCYGGTNMSTGVRAALNLSENTNVTDAVDTSGCYTVLGNTAPSYPTSISASDIYAHSYNTITWGESVDEDGDTVEYELEYSVDDGAFVQIYKGSNTRYDHFVESPCTVQYRVRAVDSNGAYSEYVTSNKVDAIYTTVPTLSVTNTDMGECSDPFEVGYTLAGVSSAICTLLVDGVKVSETTINAGSHTISLSQDVWRALCGGDHVMTVVVSYVNGAFDKKDITFSRKAPEKAQVTTAEINTASNVTAVYLEVERCVPDGAEFKVMVTRDQGETFYDATDAVVNGTLYRFPSDAPSGNCFFVQVTLTRGTAVGACYIGEIKGGWK